MQILLTSAAISLSLLVPLASVMADAPRLGAPVLVIMPPWLDADQVIHAAGGQVIGPVSAPFATLARSDDPDFATKLLQAGVWGLRDGLPLARICGVAG